VAADRDPEPVKLVTGGAPARPTFAAGRQAQFRVKAAVAPDGPPQGERFLIGRVVDQEGAPVAAVVLTFTLPGQVIACASDRQGVFRTRGAPPQRYFLGLTRKGYRPSTAHIPPEARDVEITLERLPDRSY
jgi:hypothetical protein